MISILRTCLMIVAAATLLSGCRFFTGLAAKSLEVRDVTVRLEELDWQAAHFAVDVDLYNPHRFTLPIDAVDCSLSIADTANFDLGGNDVAQIGARETATLRLPLTVRHAQVADTLLTIHRGARTLPYAGELGLSLNVMGRERRVTRALQGEIPVPRAPRISIDDFDWEFRFPAGLGGTLTLDSAEETERLGPIGRLRCDLLINGQSLARLSDPEPLGAGRVAVPWSVSGLSAIGTVRQALESGARDIRLQGMLVFDAPWGPVRVPLDLALSD